MADSPNVEGCLMGVAVGDSIGLPYEGLTAIRVGKRLGSRPLRQSLLLGRGMLSDDTEQSCLVLEAFLRSNGEVARFQRVLANKLRAWFLAIPPGVGLATVRACLRLLIGVKPSQAGVKSAGNGAAMRAPILGALLAHDLDKLELYVRACSELTHRDPRALDGARVMAFSVAQSQLPACELIPALEARCETPEWKTMLSLIAARAGQVAPAEFAREIGAVGKVSGYVLQSVPMAVFTWLTYPDQAEKGLEEVVRLGGDTDTTGATLGALYGATLGEAAFPTAWVEGIADWPRSVNYLRRLAESKANPPRVFWPASLGRNLFQLLVVLAHGFRRLVP